jgi:hypothetical protein
MKRRAGSQHTERRWDGFSCLVFSTAAIVLGSPGLPESYYHWGAGPDPLHLFLMFLLLDSMDCWVGCWSRLK